MNQLFKWITFNMLDKTIIKYVDLE